VNLLLPKKLNEMKHFVATIFFVFLFYGSKSQSSSLGGQSFCFKEMESNGTTTTVRLTLYNGGSAKISFLSETGQLLRKGDASWTGQNDGPGGDMPIITVTLSTGARLRFKAGVDQFSNKISELIDSRDRIYTSCESMTSAELEQSYERQPVTSPKVQPVKSPKVQPVKSPQSQSVKASKAPSANTPKTQPVKSPKN
jgi:hypothetical protein